jgi:hypothetical protein
MNKRQAKKETKKALLCGLCGSYRENRKAMRMYHEFEVSQRRCRTIPEDIEILIELGIYTREEADRFRYPKGEKRRNRWLRQVD